MAVSHRSTDFGNGGLLAANLGGDADTTAAVYGQLAEAYYGKTGLPDMWLRRLADRQMIEDLARDLWKLSG